MKIEPSIQIELVTFPSAAPASAPPNAEPPRHLSSPEAVEWKTFKSEKRRREWSAGRLAAKRLVRRRLREQGIARPLADIRIARLESGEPYAVVGRDGRARRYNLSISHSQGLAACALLLDGRRAVVHARRRTRYRAQCRAQGVTPLARRIGVDIEQVARRLASWLEESAHPEERSAALEKDPILQTALWTLKEAVMKFLGTGMTVGLWDIRFKADRPLDSLEDLRTSSLELHGRAREAWQSLGRPEILWRTQTLSSRKGSGPLFCLSIAYVPPQRAVHLMGDETS
ncbi:MAG: 4'-phosphopantetheinyl transferase superfamily protein [Elusimicrobia bacterium]|nr:4'-phosphopantetheinyl transferase superfamily protein [Elusimicrobiota bacterium]